MRIPTEAAKLIEKHHENCVSEDVCASCSSRCCSRGGFAIIENVLAIYDLYRSGKLRRKGYKFPKNLSLKDFIFTHFDVWCLNVGPEDDEQEFVFFHMKSIDEKGRPISIPGQGSYWDTRGELFDRNPWLNHGCVFLSHSSYTTVKHGVIIVENGYILKIKK